MKMNQLSKIFTILLCGSSVAGAYYGASRGAFLGTEHNARIIADSDAACPPGIQRTASGTCRRSHRSYFYGSDGSYGHGK